MLFLHCFICVHLRFHCVGGCWDRTLAVSLRRSKDSIGLILSTRMRRATGNRSFTQLGCFCKCAATYTFTLYNSTVHNNPQSRQSAKLSSSRRNWDYPNPSHAGECAPTPPLVPGGGSHQRRSMCHTRWRERGWESPNSDEGTYVHCGTLYIYVLCATIHINRPHLERVALLRHFPHAVLNEADPVGDGKGAGGGEGEWDKNGMRFGETRTKPVDRRQFS